MEEQQQLKIGSKVLVNLDDWLIAPDGKDYRAVFGTLKDVSSGMDMLGIIPGNGNAWFLTVGNVVILGSEIKSINYTDTYFDGESSGYTANAEFGCKTYDNRPCIIYNAD